LWVDVKGTEATLMVASKQQTVAQYLSYVQKHGGPKLAAKASTVEGLLSKANVDADEMAKLAAHKPEKGEDAAQAKLTARQKTLTTAEKAIVKALAQIFEEMRPIKPKIGKPVDDIDETKTPLGYDLRLDEGTYDYGEAYSYRQIQRAGGYGGASEDMFPKVHVTRAGNVAVGAGIYRSDMVVIDAYRAAIAPLRPGWKKRDGAPKPTDSPDALPNSLENGANKERQWNIGVRKQMEAIIKAIRDGVKVTGVEVGLVDSRVDYTAIMNGEKVMVEYKHWTGRLEPGVALQRALKLESQLTRHIEGGAKHGFKVLYIDWPAFDQLDADSQAVFEGVILDVIAFGERKDVTVTFRK
jgi:hypothetical protein